MYYYERLALRTESRDYSSILHRLNDRGVARLLHAALGMQTEASEFMDILKKYLFYSRAITKTDVKEELGDLLWYMVIACDELGISLDEVMRANVAKLKRRYPDAFTNERALIRDIGGEREVL